MNPKPRIGVLLPSLAGGGAERVMLDLVDGLSGHGARVDLVVGEAQGPLRSQVPEAAEVIELGATRMRSSVFPLVRYLRRHRPTALISSLTHTNVVAITAGSIARVPSRIVVTEHVQISDHAARSNRRTDRALIPVAGVLYRRAHAIVAVSDGVAGDVSTTLRLPRKRVVVLPNPIPAVRVTQLARGRLPPEVAEFTRGAKVVIAVGRLVRQKDFETLIRAFARAADRDRCRLLLVGDGPEKERLVRVAESEGVADSVMLTGFVSNPYPLMARADVLVSSSLWEGMPTVILEGLVLGLPIAATDCPSGPREVLETDSASRLVPVADPARLGEAITALLVTPPPRGKSRLPAEYELAAAAAAYLRVALGR